MKIGDEFISECGEYHIRILSKPTTYDNSVTCCCLCIRSLLRNKANSFITINNLKQYYIPKTEAAKLLFCKEK